MFLVYLFIIKLLARKDIFKLIEEKHGRQMRLSARRYESLKIKSTKIKADINYILTCKRESLSPTFSQVKLSIPGKNYKLKAKISKLIMEQELKNKHYQKKKVQQSISEVKQYLQKKLSLLFYLVLISRITSRILKEHKFIHCKHDRKIKQLRNCIQDPKAQELDTMKNLHNFSSLQLTNQQQQAIARGLDVHIPTKTNNIHIKSQLESFYQQISSNQHQVSEDKLEVIKGKLLDTYSKFIKIKMPKYFDDALKKLKNNKDIALIKQDKGKGTVVMNKKDYINKCLEILNTPKFSTCSTDPTKTIENRIQLELRSIKKHFSDTDYKRIYPTGSAPGKFYGMAKIHKLKQGDGIEKLQMRPIISNIGTASYQLAKYLAKMLKPLSESESNIESTDSFLTYIRQLHIPANHQLISFDVVSLFTSVPLDYTISAIINDIYEKQRIQTTIPKNKMIKLLNLCTKQVHFTFNDIIYTQTDGVAMGSPLGPIIANIFMTKLEQKVIPKLNSMSPWVRYIDDTFATIDPDYINTTLNTLNNFHPNIKFTHELETNKSLSFLDVTVLRHNSSVETTVFRKPTHNDTYLHWNSFSLKTWKLSTLKSLVLRANKICSTPALKTQELNYIRNVFEHKNGYPRYVIEKTINSIGEGLLSEKDNRKHIILQLPYKGLTGEKLIRSLNKLITDSFPNELNARILFKGTPLSSHFNLKDKTNKDHIHNLVYKITCPEATCQQTYVGETGRRLSHRIHEHCHDINSKIYQHISTTNHGNISIDNATILNHSFKEIHHRKVAEALYIKQIKPQLNKQNYSIPLKLYQ